jgi:hypothetical protein
MWILRSSVAWLFAAALAFSGCTCSKSDDAGGAPSAEPEAAHIPLRGVIEEREDGQVEWMIEPEGKIRALVRSPDGKPIAPADVRGSVTVSGKTVKLAADGEELAGAIPKLASDLTDVAYALTVKGKEWKGVLQVPRGGTDDLLVEPTVTVPEGTRGPNGGVVEVVDDQRIELVTDEASGEVRVYFLDENLKVIPVGDATVTIGFVE